MILSRILPKDPTIDLVRYESQCAGKEVHASEASALATLRFLKGGRIKHWPRSRHFHFEELAAYRCDFCDHYHLGH